MTNALEHLASALVGRYRIERELGRGGMATVYLARDLRHDRDVAIKVLHEDLGATVGKERFLREIRIVASLTHPHILPLHDSGEAGGHLFYVMPYVPGESLRARLERERCLPVDVAMHIAREIGDALAHAHRAAIVHRDVKPENILLADGHALLADFGIARAAVAAATGQLQLTGTGMIVGTAQYVSPEQAAGERDVGPASDQYALACVVYEMLAGEVPFTGPTPLSVMAKRLGGTPVPLRTLRASVPPDIEAAVDRALSREAVDRFRSVADFVQALVQAGTAPAPSPRPELSLAVLPFANLSADPENEYFSDGITEDIIAQVSKVSALKVISRTSVMRFKRTMLGLREVAAQLGVSNILEGSVRRAGDRLRITAQLIDARTDQHLWAETYDRRLTDVFEIQSGVARAIAGALRATLTAEERARLTSVGSVDVDTYNDTLLGRHYLQRQVEEAIHEGIACLDRAIARNEHYAPAHAWRGAGYAYLSLGYFSVPGGTFRKQAEASLRRALELDPALGDAMAWSANIAMQYDHDWVRAERTLLRALEVDPNSATAREMYGNLLAATGRREESARLFETAGSRDPLSYTILGNAALCAHRARAFPRAAELFARQIALNPELLAWQALQTLTMARMGRAAEAVEGARKVAATVAGTAGPLVALVAAEAGLMDEARLWLSECERLRKERNVWLFGLAMAYAGIGEIDVALSRLEEAYEARDFWMIWLKVQPELDPLRADPRFRELLRKAHFDVDSTAAEPGHPVAH